jgi:DHA1 family inner membrane transport protein
MPGLAGQPQLTRGQEQGNGGSAMTVARFDLLGRLIYVNALFIVGTLGTLITPAILESWATLQWSQSQLGLVAALELVTLASGSLSGLYWQRRWPWRRVALVSLLLAIVANLACVIEHRFVIVCIARSAAGLAGGFLCAIYSAFLANTKSPGKVIAVTNFIMIGIEALFVFCAATVFQRLGSNGLFILMTTLFVVLVPLLGVLPPGWPGGDRSDARHPAGSQKQTLIGYMLVLAFVPYIMVQSGVYTFLGEFGRLVAHLSAEQSLRTIGISVVFSSIGSVVAYVLNDRVGFVLPIGGAIAMTGGMMFAMIFASRSPLLFLLNISLLQIAWIALGCYLYSALIHYNNLLVPAATSLSSFGSAFGAGAVGLVLEHGGVTATLMLTTGALALTAMLTIPVLIRARQSEKAMPTQMAISVSNLGFE